MKRILTIFILVLFLTGCTTIPTGNVFAVKNIKDDLPSEVAKLPLMELSSIENFEKYKSFVDNINSLIKILNKQDELFNIPLFEPTQEGWEKASKFITEYGPLINNYNEVVSSAKDFEKDNNQESLKKFYISAGKFGFETTIIVTAVFYTLSFQTVGIIYRAVGLNGLALKCGPCVSTILSNAHWFVRSVLVEGSSQIAQTIIDSVSGIYETGYKQR